MSVYGELGRYPLYINRYVKIIKFWLKVISTDNVIVKTLYNSMVIADRRGLTNWATRVKTLLNNFGFTYVWNEPFTVDQTNFHHIFKSRVIDVFKQSWIKNITNSTGLYIPIAILNIFYI